MRVVGLTGGIGSGKTSVSELLMQFGAEIVDADAIVHELQAAGQPVFLAMVERWGDRVIDSESGSLDRAAVASIVFADKSELKALEAMVHPAVGVEVNRRVEAATGTDRVLIFDNPLLVKKKIIQTDHDNSGPSSQPDADQPLTEAATALDEGPKPGSWPAISALIVVDCPVEVAIRRLMEFRGFDRSDAEKRIAAQASREERLEKADFVIDNGGLLSALGPQVDECWQWIQTVPEFEPAK